MPARAPLVIVVASLVVACGSSTAQQRTGTSSPSPVVTALVSPTPSSTPSPTPAPSLDVAPLIPDLTAGGALNLLQEGGSTSASIPASTSVELFSPLGTAFLAGRQTNGQLSALVALQPDASMQTLQSITNPATFGGAVGALDGHAYAWLQGTLYSSPCNQGLSSGALEVGSAGTPPHAIAQLPKGSATSAWSLGGWIGDAIWLVQTSGCPAAGTGTTAAYIAHEDGSPLTPVQAALGSGCALTAMALDGSMLCTTAAAVPSRTAWRYVAADGSARSFNAASLGTVCAGHGTLHDFEGFALSLDGGSISVDAGCAGSARFDQLFVIATASGTAQLVATQTYLAADAYLPDGSLLCTDLSNPMAPQSYLVSRAGSVGPLAAGDAIWSVTDVTW